MDSFRVLSRIVAFIILFNIFVITIINAGIVSKKQFLKLILILSISRLSIFIRSFRFNLSLSRTNSYSGNVDSEGLKQRFG